MSRILKEIATLQDAGFKPVLNDDSCYSLNVAITGPNDSPFVGGTFSILIEIPTDYPLSPPKLSFRTRVCHPNIHFQVRSNRLMR
jgi:ubiquitin-protein ligase